MAPAAVVALLLRVALQTVAQGLRVSLSLRSLPAAAYRGTMVYRAPIGPVGPSGSGTGDVLRSGIPTTGQIAQWTDASHIVGVNLSSIVTPGQIVTKIFTANGTYTPTVGMSYCIIECVGGGGGGGGASDFGSINNVITGGGGGSGGYSRKKASAADIGVSKTVTIGAGGTAGNHRVSLAVLVG